MSPTVLAAAKVDLPGLVCIDIAIIIVVARLMGWVFKRLHQPAVVGEIIGGILLGPSFLGLFPGNPTAHLFPPSVIPTLTVLAQLGVVVFVFIVGLEVDLGLIRGRQRVAATVSFSSVALPFGLGMVAALLLHEEFAHIGSHEVKLLPFALFIGATMSVTAFPVLARLLSERNMLGTELGSFALACAAMDDVLAWTVVAVVIGVIKSSSPLSFLRIVLELAAFVIVVLFAARPALRWLFERDRMHGSLSLNTLAATVVGTLVAAWATDKIGINLIFGAFFFGAAVPKHGYEALVAEIVERLESAILLLLLPIFFVVAGLSVDVRTLHASDLPYLLLILAVAIGGKFFGAALAARAQGVTRRRAMALGTLMNTRGLTELVILTIGLTIGVLDVRLYTLLVIMALVTTLMTSPMLRRVYPERMLQADIAEAQQRLVSAGRYSVLVLLNGVDDSRSLTSLGAGLAGPGGNVLLARLLERDGGDHLRADLSVSFVRMAAVMEELNTLAADHEGVTVSPIAQLTDDVAADASALLARTSVNAAITGPAMVGSTSDARRLCGEAECDVATLVNGREPPERRVLGVLAGASTDGAVLETAARLQLSLGEDARAPLGLVPASASERGRARRLAERLRSIDVSAGSVEEPMGGAPLMVSAWPADGFLPRGRQREETLVLVDSTEDPERVGIDQRLVRLDFARRLPQAAAGAAGTGPTMPAGAEP